MTSPRTLDVAALLESRKLTGFNYRVIGVSLLITFLDGFDLLMLSHTASYMADDIGLDKLQLGNVFSIGLFGMMLGGFFFGYLGDRIGRRPTIILSTFSFGFLTLLFALAGSYEALLALRFFNGFALGAMLPLCWALNIEFVPKRYRSTVVTIIMVGFSLGGAMAGPLSVWLAPRSGWQSVFVLGGVTTLASSVLLLFTLPESVRFLVSKQRRPEQVARILRRLDPGLEVAPNDRYILGDEVDLGAYSFRISQLFAGKLRWITPMIWIGFGVSSMAMYFLASWSPLVYTYAGLRSRNGVVGQLLRVIQRCHGRFGPHALRRSQRALRGDDLSLVVATLPTGIGCGQPAGGRVHRAQPDRGCFCQRQPLRNHKYRRPVLSQRDSCQWRWMGCVGGQDRFYLRSVAWRLRA